MKQARMVLLVALLPLLAACSQATSTPPQEKPTATGVPQTSNMEIIELPETQPYLAASVKGDTGVVWSAVTSSPQPAGNDQAGRAVQSAIKMEATRLASIDYSALSLPLYMTVTQSLKLSPGDFTGDQISIDARGSVAGTEQWVLYSWRGPQVEQLPNRPQVTRWVQVYALYDLQQNKVARLIATLRGQAIE